MNRKFKKVVFIVIFIVLLLLAYEINVLGAENQTNNAVEAEEAQEKKDKDAKKDDEEAEKITTINLKYDSNIRMYQNDVKYYQIQDSIKITGGNYELSTSSIGLKVCKVNQKLLGKTSRILHQKN